MVRWVRALVALLALGVLAACGAAPDTRAPATRDDVTALTLAILALSPEVDPEEAARAAQISYDYSRTLAIQYQITDPPLVHNAKVNSGRKPRGLCWHWAEDMEARLKAEDFQTLDIHRAIANWDNWRIEHSTALISPAGHDMFNAIVVDPWRKGGVLTWVPTLEDARYEWTPQLEVLRKTGRLLNANGEPVPG
ncbi:MAG: hypothetical protein AAGA87_01645 [Pseudomonadota bacterium]